MRIRRSFVRVAVASLILTLPSGVWAAYNWSGVAPANNSNNVNTAPLSFNARVNWTNADPELPNGSVEAEVKPKKGGVFGGVINLSYMYSETILGNGAGHGDFVGLGGAMERGKQPSSLLSLQEIPLR